jgi:glycerate 2-kinase
MVNKMRNFEILAANSPLREKALEIAEAGLQAIDTREIVARQVRLTDTTLEIAGEAIQLSAVNQILVIAVGKCGLEAGMTLEQILGERLSAGVVVDVHEGTLEKLKVFSGTHPFPSERNIDATKAIIATLRGLDRKDLVIFIVSGGGSTLLCQPQNITCLQEEIFLKCMFESGANIREINTVRKHLSFARGGWLAKYAYPAKVVALIFSDVPGGEPEFVASGPTILDTTTVEDAESVLKKYDLEKRCGISPNALIETPKDKKYFANVRNVVVVSNKIALEAMEKTAVKLGYCAITDPLGLNGEASERATAMAKALTSSGPGSAILWGGESTVTIKNKAGKGGRNLEFALAALSLVNDRQIIVSIASDGRDNTDFAGGIADHRTIEHAVKLKLDPREFLARHSSYDFFSKTGDYIMTGDTGSNVADLAIALYE